MTAETDRLRPALAESLSFLATPRPIESIPSNETAGNRLQDASAQFNAHIKQYQALQGFAGSPAARPTIAGHGERLFNKPRESIFAGTLQLGTLTPTPLAPALLPIDLLSPVDLFDNGEVYHSVHALERGLNHFLRSGEKPLLKAEENFSLRDLLLHYQSGVRSQTVLEAVDDELARHRQAGSPCHHPGNQW